MNYVGREGNNKQGVWWPVSTFPGQSMGDFMPLPLVRRRGIGADGRVSSARVRFSWSMMLGKCMFQERWDRVPEAQTGRAYNVRDV